MNPPDHPTANPPFESPEEPEEQVTIQVDEAYAQDVDRADLAAAITATLAAEGHAEDRVTLVVTSDEAVAQLNLEYRGLEEPTDVLSFPAQTETPGFVAAPEMAGYLGDIIVALPYTQRQAAEIDRPLRDELRLLAVHGTLHLLGYDHGTPAEEAVMWAQQDAVLARLNQG
jgi:probable rRNA maturation factor